MVSLSLKPVLKRKLAREAERVGCIDAQIGAVQSGRVLYPLV